MSYNDIHGHITNFSGFRYAEVPLQFDYSLSEAITEIVIVDDLDFVAIQPPLTKVVNFATNRICFNITLLDDFDTESNESFMVVLASETTGVLIRSNVAEIFILDGEQLSGSLANFQFEVRSCA